MPLLVMYQPIVLLRLVLLAVFMLVLSLLVFASAAAFASVLLPFFVS